ncbi:MAG: aminoglycoside phosphotransferase family protein [Dehalococcoidia bacterium]
MEPSADLEGASRLGEGWACVAWRVPTSHGALALRIPKPGSWWAATDLEREARLLPALEARGLPVPRGARLLRDERGTVLGALQSLIEGVPLRQLPPYSGVRWVLAVEIGRFLQRLHATPLQGAGSVEAWAAGGTRPAWAPPGDGSGDMWSDHYVPLIEQAARRLPSASARWLEARARRFVEQGGMASAPRALIHGDCSSEHLLIVKERTLAGVIDWADAMVGDPALDFAALLSASSRSLVKAVLEAYTLEGGSVDADAKRRVQFYLDVAPVFGVLFAEDGGFPEIARADRRRFAARAAAAGRASQGGA